MKTGVPLLPPASVDPSESQKSGGEVGAEHGNPFLAVFPCPVETMQAVDERGVVHLWTACDETLYQFRLGQRRI